MVTNIKKKELNEVHLLRAVAAISVTIFHLFLGNPELFPEKSILSKTTSYGYLGVEIFFILSGYIICYSLPINYRYSNLKSFLIKRIVRIYPAYFVSILLVIILNYFSHYITHTANTLSWLDIFSNLFFFTNFGLGDYINVVYWTLGIEIQFYVLIGLSFMLIKNSNGVILYILILLAISSLPKTPNMDLIFPNLSIFALGILTFFYKKKEMLKLRSFLILSFSILVHIYFFLGTAVLIASCICLFILLFWTKTNKVIIFFSNISFSLYLIHVTVGGKVINLVLRYINTLPERYLLFVSSFAITIFFSYLFYYIIEKPTLAWSKNIRYTNVEA